jgi:FkbM family methyltransferase
MCADDEIDIRIVKHLVKPGETVIDVGASFGIYTSFLSSTVGEKGIVYSMEPIPLTYDILTFIIKKQKLQNVTPYNFALSDSDRVVKMEIPETSSGVKDFYRARIVKGSSPNVFLKHYELKCRALDFLELQIKDRLSFIKIDVEEHELQVLQGGKGIIKKYMPALLIEITGNPNDENSSAHMVFDTLLKFGYSAYWYDGTKLLNSIRKNDVTNYFFLTKSQAIELKTKFGLLNE